MNDSMHSKHVQHFGLHRFPFLSACRMNAIYPSDVFHSHQGLEFYYVHAGSGELLCDGSQFPLLPGHFYVFQPFQLHRMRFDRGGCVRTFILFEPLGLKPIWSSFPSSNRYVKKLMEEPIPTPLLSQIPEDHPLVHNMRLLHESITDKNMTEDQRLEMGAAYLLAMLQGLQVLKPLQDIDAAASSTGISHIGKVLEWIEAHLTEVWTLEELAQEIHLHPNYVSTLFHQEVGCPIREYVSIRRVNLARKWLLNSDLQVQEIAARLGIANVSHFCKTFKTLTGATPYRYKKQFFSAQNTNSRPSRPTDGTDGINFI